MTPLVSIVIPAFNGGRYLRESVESVLNQDHPYIELLVLDDGSTDNTREILNSYGSQFYWESHANMGQANTLNKGWSMAKGEILSYLSVDDILESHAVRVSVEQLFKHEEAILTYGDYWLIDADGDAIRHVSAPDFNYLEMVANMVCQPGPGVFFRRSAFEIVGGWDRSLHQLPDYEYWLRLGLHGTFLHIREPLARFRVHDDSQSYAVSSTEKSEECIRVIHAYFKREDIPGEIRSLKRQAFASAHLIAARLHLRAGRYQRVLGHLIQAWKCRARSLIGVRAARLLANGILFRIRRRLERLIA